MNKDIIRLRSIIRYCQKIEETMKEFGEDMEDFLDNPQYQDLCSFYILQIGENTKNLHTKLTDKHTEINWNNLRKTRNNIAHIYENVDYEMTWSTITEEIPIIKEACEKILYELEQS